MADEVKAQINVDSVIREEIRFLSPYHVQDASGMVKLDAMENPYMLPDVLRRRIAELTSELPLNRYPDSAARALKSELRSALAIPDGMGVVLGNGSDELIQMLALAVAKPGAVMLGLEPSFAMFRMIAAYIGMRYVGVQLNRNFTLNAGVTLAAIAEHQPAIVFLAYPNNPTGNLFEVDAVERVINATPGIVVIDEAYHPFAGASFMDRLADFPNLLVMRTLSKLGLAGVRLGLVTGREEWLQQIDKLRLPYNVNVLTQCVAVEVLRYRSTLEVQAASIRAERSRVISELRRIAGIEVYESRANFVLFKVAAGDRVFNGLKERKILIKNLNNAHPLLENSLRATVGTPEENDLFLRALSETLLN